MVNFYSGNIKKYSILITDLASKNIKLSYNQNKKGWGREIKNILFNEEDPVILNKAKVNKEELFISNKLFRPYSEIVYSFETLQDIYLYLGIFPLSKKITKYRYLRYNIESYLQEVYILKGRLIFYLRTIRRAYRGSKIEQNLNIKIKKLENEIEKFFDSFASVRGRHVHENRYTDKDMDRLALFDVLSKSQDEKFVKIIELLYKLAYNDIRKKYKKLLDNHSKNILKILDIYFKTLLDNLTQNGKFIFPL